MAKFVIELIMYFIICELLGFSKIHYQVKGSVEKGEKYHLEN